MTVVRVLCEYATRCSMLDPGLRLLPGEIPYDWRKRLHHVGRDRDIGDAVGLAAPFHFPVSP